MIDLDRLDRKQVTQLRDMLTSVINKASVKLLRTCNAEQVQLLNLFLQDAEWGAWRIQLVDEKMREMSKIMGYKPVKKRKVKKDV